MTPVDVVIRAWRRLEATLAAIDSVLAQDGVDLRLYVLDQGNAAAYGEALRRRAGSDSRLVIVTSPINVGAAGGSNLVSAAGARSIIVGIDNDCILADPRAIERAVRALEETPELGAIAFRILEAAGRDNDPVTWGYGPHLWPRREERFEVANFIGAGYAVRRDVLEAAGGYDERLFFGHEELDLGLRICNLGVRIEYRPEITVTHSAAAEARVGWENGRLYYFARNALYIAWKAGLPPTRLVRIAGGMTLRGLGLGRPLAALRGLVDGAWLIWSWRPSSDELRRCRLNPQARRRVLAMHATRSEGLAGRLRRAWSNDRLDGRTCHNQRGSLATDLTPDDR